MSAVLQFTVTLESTTCPVCGVEFAAPGHLLRSLRDNGGTIYCPSGHQGSWRETAADRLRKELDRAKARTVAAECQAALANEEAARAQRQTAALRGVVTKTKARVGRGVCPCCNRTFVALGRHMSTQHPEYRTSDAEVTP
jgi:DNA repair exonuclease SbcCD ATPase subunit